MPKRKQKHQPALVLSTAGRKEKGTTNKAHLPAGKRQVLPTKRLYQHPRPLTPLALNEPRCSWTTHPLLQYELTRVALSKDFIVLSKVPTRQLVGAQNRPLWGIIPQECLGPRVWKPN